MKILSLIYFLLAILYIAAVWVIFTKAKKPGWAAIVPIYDCIVFFEVVRKPWWWIFLLLIPLVNVVIMIIAIHRLSLSFGQGVGFTIGLILLGFIFMPMLAFGNYNYTPLDGGGTPAPSIPPVQPAS